MGTGEKGGRASSNIYMRLLVSCVETVALRPYLTLLIAFVLVAGASYYSSQTIRMNSDDSTLISQDEPFRQHYKDFVDRFPQFEETTVIVITSSSIDLAEDAVDRLSAALLLREDLIATLYAPSADPFFEDHGLLYLDDGELEDVIERLAEAQPALTTLVEDPSLRGLFDEIESSLDELEEEGELPSGFARMVGRINLTAESLLAGRPKQLGWADEFLGIDDEVDRLIIVQGRKYFEEAISSARLIDGIRETARQLELTPQNGVNVRLTGMVPLAHDEQESLQEGLALAGIVAITLLVVILGFGVRSLRIVVATLVALIASLSWTTAYAMLTVGEFNIISAAFGVLLLGLGVDFAIHIGLQYEEQTSRGYPVSEALRRATEDVGGAVSLCGLTSAVGFFAFVPTRYYGLGALGIIAGGGMFMSLIASFTVFPAMLAIMRAPSRQTGVSTTAIGRLYPLIERRAGVIVLSAVIVAVLAVGASTRMTFDFSTLGMKDKTSESMVTLLELQRKDIVTDYSATVLAPDLDTAEELAKRLEALEWVSEARSPYSFLPENQPAKLEALEDAAFFLESVLYPEPPKPPPTAAERRASTEGLLARIESMPAGDADDPAWQATDRLGGLLERVLATPDPDDAVEQLERLVVSDITERIGWLGRALQVEEVGFDDLPQSLRERLVSADGWARVAVLPAQDMSDVVQLTRFVNSVATVDPRATGRPAVEAGIGDIVVSTFRTAIGIAVVVVGLILLIVLRSPLDALTVLAPITLAAFITIALGVALGMRFNMANVVVIPLVVGLGVDNGIHVFMRYRQDGSLDEMVGSSTPRAVLLSAMTTLAAFGSLSLSGHWGIHSMGVLLSIAVVSLIVCTLVVLPSILLVMQRWRAGRSGSAPSLPR